MNRKIPEKIILGSEERLKRMLPIDYLPESIVKELKEKILKWVEKQSIDDLFKLSLLDIGYVKILEEVNTNGPSRLIISWNNAVKISIPETDENYIQIKLAIFDYLVQLKDML